MGPCKFHFSQMLLPDGWARDVGIETDDAGMITAVLPGAAGAGESLPGVAVPGLANVHSHAHQRAMAGLAERSGPGADSFWTWREAMYGFALKMRPEELQAVAAQLYVECLKAGFTSVGEFQYLHHQPDGTPYANRAELSLRCLEAAREAGISMTMLPVLYAYGGFGGQAANAGQRRFLNNQQGFQAIIAEIASSLRGHERMGIAPHSLRAVTVELLREVMTEAGPVHIHIAEQIKEVEDCLAFNGKRPVEYLSSEFDLNARWSLIHATHMNARETSGLAASGAHAALCPVTEANLGDGIFNGVDYMSAGGAIAIGTDSHVSVGAAEELRVLEYSQRYLTRARTVLSGGAARSTGRNLFEAALAGGARSIAQPASGIRVGQRLDAVVLDDEHPALIGRKGDGILDSWIFSGGSACVRDVIAGGKIVVRDGHHAREAEIKTKFAAAMKRLQE